jgi:hypothetical protein
VSYDAQQQHLQQRLQHQNDAAAAQAVGVCKRRVPKTVRNAKCHNSGCENV